MFLSSGQINFTLNNGISNRLDVKSSEVISTGEWHHLVGSYNGNSDESGLKLYDNGVELTKIIQDNTLNASTINNASMLIGSRSDGYYIDGQISNVKIYNRALTADEVLQNYNSQKYRFI